jgi:hypothetical protein
MAPSQMTAQQLNLASRQLVLQNAVEMTQNIYSNTINPTNTPVVNIQPRYAGLIKHFIVEITATITNTAGASTLVSDFNAANLLSQINFVDLNNNTRIATTGWHIHFLNSIRRHRVYGAAALLAAMDTPIKYGSNFAVISATATVTASGTGTVVMKYLIPLAYSDDDLSGAIYANVVNATMNLQLVFNNNPSPASGDSTSTVYVGNSATITSATINVLQVYLDQIPQGQAGPILPAIDLATIYELKNTTFTGMVAGNDFPIQYANFRQFLSTFLIYVNAAAGTRTAGTDINYLALLSANSTYIQKIDPIYAAMRTRNMIGTDLPNGCYYFDFRRRPLSTIQYGNLQLVINPSTASAGAYALVGWEAFAYVNNITQAGSLSAS